jgi:hypothetical protein
MINSVGEYVAGERYNLKKEEGERFVQLGYAEGELSEDATPLAEDESRHQVVSFDG